jgi:phosphatidylinositol 4-kinase
MTRNLRQRALERIAALSADSTTSFDKSDLERLGRAIPGRERTKDGANGTASKSTTALGRVPMVRVEQGLLNRYLRKARRLTEIAGHT